MENLLLCLRSTLLLVALLALIPSASPAGELGSENFRIVGVRDTATAQQTINACEQLRRQLFAFWFDGQVPQPWQPKCLVVIHPTDPQYLAAVGASAGSTVASSLVDDRRGVIFGRRIDIRASRAGWLSALPHELTHVVLADHFAGKSLPRWADEGMAILADPADKRERHASDLMRALGNRQQFRLVELIELREYPSASRWGCFYGQSASLAAHLIELKSPRDFIRFIDVSLAQGTPAALRTVYGFPSMGELEARWHRETVSQPESLATRLAAQEHTIMRRKTVID